MTDVKWKHRSSTASSTEDLSSNPVWTAPGKTRQCPFIDRVWVWSIGSCSLSCKVKVCLRINHLVRQELCPGYTCSRCTLLGKMLWGWWHGKMTGSILTLHQPWWGWDGKKASMLHSATALGYGLRNKSGVKESLYHTYSGSGQAGRGSPHALDCTQPWMVTVSLREV